MSALNQDLFIWITEGVSSVPWLHKVGLFAAHGLGLTFFIVLTGFTLTKPARFRYLRDLYLPTAAAVLLTHGLKLLFAVNRPFVFYGQDNTFFNLLDGIGSSFPSGHAATYAAMSVAAAIIWRRYALSFLGVAALIALGRVIAGVHWPLDVLAGSALGAGTAVLYHVALEFWQRRRGNTAAILSKREARLAWLSGALMLTLITMGGLYAVSGEDRFYFSNTAAFEALRAEYAPLQAVPTIPDCAESINIILDDNYAPQVAYVCKP